MFDASEDQARRLDHQDRLARFRDRFHVPLRPDGRPVIYLCGHSLGLQPKGVRSLIEQELDDWARLGVEAHFRGRTPWYSYHETVREPLARLVGARPHEVVAMNSLTVNLHLMMATFYRPGEHSRILIDEPAFPSDLYAVQSQLRWHGRRPETDLIVVCSEDVEAVIEANRPTLILLNGVNFFTGQLLDIPRLTAAAHRHGCVIGWDLAHAAGNVELKLHEWDVDFAVWCSYKYLNSGPGAVAGCFVHERHGRNLDLPRLAGWWGNDPATRFQMPGQFVPKPGADGWQVSNPPILALAPLRASLALFDEATMPTLRTKSEKLTGYLLDLLSRLPAGRFEVITPREANRRGCQVSLVDHERPHELMAALEAAGVVCDFREPNVIRVAPVPMYNTFHEVWTFSCVLAQSIERKNDSH